MEYVNLGSTGLKVSRICLGTMTYGSKKWREWVLEDAEAGRSTAVRSKPASTFLIPRICIRLA